MPERGKMHRVVKIIIRDDGQKVEYEDQKWCLVIEYTGSPCTLCSLEVFGYGEGAAIYDEKLVKKGNITCLNCINKIKEIKKIRL